MIGPWTAYLFLRAFISPIDFVTDIIHASSLIYSGHPIWGVLTLVFPFCCFLAACIYVLIGKCQRGDPMSSKKFCILTFSLINTTFEALFESIPQLLLQCTAIWRGVVKFEAVFRDPDFWGVLSLVSIFSSFVSIIVTSTYYNDEKWDGGRSAGKFMLSLAVSTSGILFRMYVGSLMFAVTPYWAIGIASTFYLIHLIAFKCFGFGWKSAFYSYTLLTFPSGHSKQLGDSPGTNFCNFAANTAGHSVSEVRRARVTQESLLKQARLSHGLFSLLNLLSLISYAALMETHLFSHNYKSHPVILEATNRLILYLIPVLLLLMNAAFSWVYVHHVKVLRDAVRTWDAITPSVPSIGHSSGSRRRPTIQTAVTTPGSPPPPYYEQQLPLNPSYPSLEISERPASPSSNYGSRPHARPGNSKCENDNCVTCDMLITGTSFRSTMTGKEYKFMPSVGCHTKNVIYLVTCDKCKKQYVGKTAQTLKQRHYGHRREIDKESSHLGQHFAGACGYTSFRIQIIDHTMSSDGLQRREGYWQHELMTLLPWGLNTRDELSGVDVMTLAEST